MLLPQFQKDTYSEEDVVALCKIGDLQPQDIGQFRKSLEDSAAVCRWENSGRKERPKSSEISRELKSVLNRARRLREAIEGLSDYASWQLDKGISRSQDTDFARHRRGLLASDDPTMLILINDPENEIQAIQMELSDLKKIVHRFEEACDQSTADLPKRPPGKNRDWGLRLWMINMKSLWERTTEAPFSRDVTSSNEPITNAARFCAAAYTFIDPNCPTSLVMREMKECIADANRRTGRDASRK